MFHIEDIMKGVKNRIRSKLDVRTLSLLLYVIPTEALVKLKIKFEKKSDFCTDVSPGIPMASFEKNQPIWSSRLAGYI